MIGNLKGKRIFYVEDNLKNLTLTRAVLEAAGAEFRSEPWMREFTLNRLIEALPLNLILLDLMFPQGISGYEIFDVIRADARFEGVPIVAISAADPTMEMPKVRAKGFSGFIAKPISLSLLPSQINQILDGKAVWYAG